MANTEHLQQGEQAAACTSCRGSCKAALLHGPSCRATGPVQLDTVPSPAQRLASRVSGRAMPRAKKMSHCNEERRHRPLPLTVGAHGSPCHCTEDNATIWFELLVLTWCANTRRQPRRRPCRKFCSSGNVLQAGARCRRHRAAAASRHSTAEESAQVLSQTPRGIARVSHLPTGTGLAQQAAEPSNGHQPLVACQPIKVVGQFKCRGDGRLNDRRAARCSEVRDRRLDWGVCAQAAGMSGKCLFV